jgi:hypothetical protein
MENRPTVILAHGASGTSASMRPHVEGLARRGIDCRAIDLPKRKAELAVAPYLAAAGLADLDDAGSADVVVGGHSYGGRVASLAAAAVATPFAGLVLLSYPLHRPGSPAWEERSAHWSAIRCPVLLLSGESDPFARIDLLREAVATLLPTAELVTWPRVGHGLGPVLDEALDRIAAFVSSL